MPRRTPRTPQDTGQVKGKTRPKSSEDARRRPEEPARKRTAPPKPTTGPLATYAPGHHAQGPVTELMAWFCEHPRELRTLPEILQAPTLPSDLSETEVRAAVGHLLLEGELSRTKDGRIGLNLEERALTGRLGYGRDGRAYLRWEFLEEPIIILDRGVLPAFHGDTLEVWLLGWGHDGLEALYRRVVKRVQDAFVGTLEEGSRHSYFMPQWSKIKPDFIIPNNLRLGAKDGDKVLVKLVRWEGPKPEGEVIEVLGKAGEHRAEMHAIVLEFDLPRAFAPETLKEADELPDVISAEEIAQRRDFRAIPTFTIDPVDAKDFDDALSFRELEDGNYEVGVHIADVTHYLRPGTALDDEGAQRATSVYLVDRTIPMLPERISNHLCSLVPHQDRLAYAAVFTLNHDGQVLSEWFGRTVIHSHRRFSYEEVQTILDAEDGEWADELMTLNSLAYTLRQQRFAQGAISFETEEVKFVLDEQMRPVEVMKKVRTDSHKLIEDFMLLANRRVAHYVATHRKKPVVPMVYRIHDVPSREKMQTLSAFVSSLGYKLDLATKAGMAKSINKLIASSAGKAEENLVQSVAIRAMPKAIYTTSNVGHYGLGFHHYTHFTSPIRRYPDVMVHRILDDVLHGRPPRDAHQLEELCRHCSERERKAADAERASVKYKQVEFLEAHLGMVAEGMVSGVTEWGIYIELDHIKCEGMVPLRDLPGDYYELDEANYRLVGRRTGHVIRLGDRARIRVKKTNLNKRTADFQWLEHLS